MSILDTFFKRLHQYMTDGVTEISMIEPFKIWTLSGDGWKEHIDNELTSDWVDGFTKQLANHENTPLSIMSPILSTSLKYSVNNQEKDFRIEVIIEPVALHKTFSIRVPSDKLFTLGELSEQGRLKTFKQKIEECDSLDDELNAFYKNDDPYGLLLCGVKQHRNILISGATGSGKTTVSKALINEIPEGERIVSLEDASELKFNQSNAIKLFFPSSKKSEVKITPRDILASCMRLNPDRIILAEIRNDEAYHYINAIASGHSGITTVHANSAKEALHRVAMLIKQTEEGNSFTYEELMHMVKSSIDLVVHFEHRQLTDVYLPFMDKS